jgi:O-antigen ligase
MIADSYIFTIHQFILCFLVLFFLYYAWIDLKDKSTINTSRIPTTYYLVMFTSIVLGLYLNYLSEWGIYSIILSLAFAILTTMSLIEPKFATSFFVFLLISRPWEFYKNELMSSMLRDIFILSMLSLIAHRIIKKQFYFQWNLTSTLVLFYACWTFLTLFAAGLPGGRLLEFNEVFVKNIIVYFLIVNTVDSKKSTLPIKAAIFLGITEKALISGYKVFVLRELGDGASQNRMTGIGMIENANDIAAILIIAIPFTVGLFQNIKNFVIRNFLAICAFLFYSILIWQARSRGAILGIGAFFVVLYWLKSKNKKIATFLVVIGASLTLFAISNIKRSSEDVDSSTNNRMIFWKAGINMAVRNPLFGVGYAGFIPNLQRYVNGNIGSDGTKMTIHSTWLLALAETGFIGFTLYMGIWFSAIRAAWKVKYEYPEYILALISYGVAITFLSHTYMLYPWLLISVALAAGKFENDKRQTFLT